MESHVLPVRNPNSILRKMLVFNTTLGLTLPKVFCNVLGLDGSSYVKISFKKPDQIIIQKHDPGLSETGNNGN